MKVREVPGDLAAAPRGMLPDQWLSGGVPGMKPDVSRGAGTVGPFGSDASGFPPLPPPLHATADPSSATLAATIVKDRLMPIVSSGFRGGWRRLHLACLQRVR